MGSMKDVISPLSESDIKAREELVEMKKKIDDNRAKFKKVYNWLLAKD